MGDPSGTEPKNQGLLYGERAQPNREAEALEIPAESANDPTDGIFSFFSLKSLLFS